MKASRVFLSGLVVFAATAVVASAAQRPEKSFRSSRAHVIPRAPQGTLLWDQLAGDTGVGIVSQDFEAVFDAYDAMGAVDFVVPAAQTWTASQLFFPGVYFNGPGPMPVLHLTFYNDAAGLPGAAIPACTYPTLVNGVDFTDVAGTLTVTLPAPCVLGTGTYWVSPQAQMDFGVGGEWGWNTGDNNPLSVNNGKWQNPGLGFGACATWGDMQTCIGPAGEGPDFLFQLTGTVPVELQDFRIE